MIFFFSFNTTYHILFFLARSDLVFFREFLVMDSAGDNMEFIGFCDTSLLVFIYLYFILFAQV